MWKKIHVQTDQKKKLRILSPVQSRLDEGLKASASSGPEDLRRTQSEWSLPKRTRARGEPDQSLAIGRLVVQTEFLFLFYH